MDLVHGGSGLLRTSVGASLVSSLTPTLHGRYVRLEPLGLEHVSGLVLAASEDRATFGYLRVPEGAEAMGAYVEDLLAEVAVGMTIAFAQVDACDGRAVGVTRYLNLRPFAREIGGTWLAASAQRRGINVEAKLLLLTHGFDDLGLARIDLKSDVRNERSRLAIERLGARFEGVLRQWQPSQVAGEEHLCRDTAMYSVIAAEWPAVRHGLLERLALP